MKHRRTQNGVEIKKWNKDKNQFFDETLDEDKFVGELIRAIRNTHHGYISKKKI